MKRESTFLFFALPGAIFIFSFSILSIVSLVVFSFVDYNVFSKPEFVGIKNYINLLSDKYFWACFANSLFITIAAPLLVILSLVLALLFRSNYSRNKFFRAICFLPSLTPVAIIGIMWQWIFSEDYGILNYLLSFLGISKVKWLSSSPENLISVMIATIWRGAGYYMMIFLAALSSIPKELEEAAQIDGANKIQIALKVIIPNIWNTVVFVFVISASSAIRLFSEMYVMIPGLPTDNKSLVYYLYTQSFEKFKLGYGSAIAFVVFLISLIFSFYNFKLLEKKNNF